MLEQMPEWGNVLEDVVEVSFDNILEDDDDYYDVSFDNLALYETDITPVSLDNLAEPEVPMESVNELPSMELDYLPRHANRERPDSTPNAEKISIPPKGTPTILT